MEYVTKDVKNVKERQIIVLNAEELSELPYQTANVSLGIMIMKKPLKIAKNARFYVPPVFLSKNVLHVKMDFLERLIHLPKNANVFKDIKKMLTENVRNATLIWITVISNAPKVPTKMKNSESVPTKTGNSRIMS